jgi:glycerol-3-phosphate dehydrogenase (NAD(P)+)
MIMARGEATQPALVVLGAGSWGTTLAIIAARNGLSVTLWGHDAGHVARLRTARNNARYLPGISFPSSLQVSAELGEAARGVSRFLVVVPSAAFQEALSFLKPLLDPASVVAWATKGMEPGRARLLSEVAEETLGSASRTAVISGPSFAPEVASGLPTAMTVASRDADVAESVAGWLRNDRLRLYTSDDVTGVEVGGAVKNVLAIATGICDGLKFGANARAALITRGLAEMRRFAAALGARPETLMGLAGVGDLVLTCTDDQSRNRRVGLALASGKSLDDSIAALGQVAEGVAAARAVLAAARARGIEMPITEQVCRVLFEGVAPIDAVTALLRRDPRAE